MVFSLLVRGFRASDNKHHYYATSLEQKILNRIHLTWPDKKLAVYMKQIKEKHRTVEVSVTCELEF